MNKYLKKLISTAMALSMLFSASSAVFADENVPLSNENSEVELYANTGTKVLEEYYATYTFDYDNETLTIDGKDNAGGNSSILSWESAKDRIKEHYRESGMKTVIINDGIDYIGNDAFYGYNIYSLTLPSTLESIRYRAFRGSLDIDKLIIPSSVKIIEKDSFESCAIEDGIYLEGYPGGTVERKGNGAWGATVDGTNKSTSIPSNVYYLSDMEIEPIEDQTYHGKSVTPNVTVKLITKDTEGVTQSETTLKNGIDYVVSYENNTGLGTATVNISYIGDYSNYAGDVSTTTFNITQSDISNATVNPIPTQMHTGSEITPKPVVKFGNETLTEGVDYTLSYKNNIKPNSFSGQTPQIIITGIGDYTGEKTVDFTITSQSYSLSYPYEIVYEFGYEPMYLTDFLTLTCSDGTILKGSEIGNISAYGVDDIGGMGNQCDWENAVTVEFFISSFSMEASQHGIATETDYYDVPISPLVIDEEFLIDLAISTDLGDAEYDADSYLRLPSQTYTGEPIDPYIQDISWSGIPLGFDDFALDNYNNINAGTAIAELRPNNIQNYAPDMVAGSVTIPFTIEPRNLSDVSIDVETDIEYEGYEVIPEITATYKGMTLVEGKDYDVTYTNNNVVGTATATITGKGNYAGTIEKEFEILTPDFKNRDYPIDMSLITVTCNESRTYTGSQITDVKPTLVYEMSGSYSYELKEGIDYTLEYGDNENAGTKAGTIVATGIRQGDGGFEGNTDTIMFDIAPAQISTATATITSPVTYTGSELTPAPNITFNGIDELTSSDYSVSYENNVNVGIVTATITGKGNFTGTDTINFNIVARPLTNEDVEFSAIPECDHTGEEVKPEPSITVDGKTLVKDTDYTLSYENNTEVGTATVTATLKGNYIGTVSTTFEITSPMLTAENTTISTIAPMTYSKIALTPEPEVRLGNAVLTKDVDYTLSYENNVNVGTATVKVTGIGKYEGEVTGTFTINPKNANYFIVVILDDWQ